MSSSRTGLSRLIHDHGDVVVVAPLRVILIILVALIVRRLAHRAIDRFINTTADSLVPRALSPLRERIATAALLESAVLPSERRRQRADTIGSLLKSAVSIAVFAMGFLMILRALHIDITPLIAGTSIAGVALGFGAQNIVKDFLAGIFMILEDQYGVGDVIDVKEATGVVEAVGLRTTRLRDEYGTVWYVRNGEIIRVGNQSQGYAQVVLDIPIEVGISVAAAAQAILAVAQEMSADDEWSADFLEEPELQGVQELTREQTTLRLAARVRPLQQWPVARELRRRIRERLDAQEFAGATVGAAADSPSASAPTSTSGSASSGSGSGSAGLGSTGSGSAGSGSTGSPSTSSASISSARPPAQGEAR